MTRSPLELLHIQYAALYHLDPDGRMLSVNEPGTPVAPRFFMGRTAEGHLVRFHHDLPAELAATITQLCADEPAVDDLELPPRYAPTIRSLLGVDADSWRGPTFTIPAQTPVIPGAILLQPDQADLLARHFAPLARDFAQRTPVTALIVDGHAVAVCCDARRSEASGEAGVETAEGYRGRGYAAMVVSLWAQVVHASGRIPLYSTTWGNIGSRAVARKLGLTLFGENWEIF